MDEILKITQLHAADLPLKKFLKTHEDIKVPRPGYVWNPLRRYPPNLHCFCDSTKKAKNCCLPKLAETILQEKAVQVEKYMAYVEETFYGKESASGENQDQAEERS